MLLQQKKIENENSLREVGSILKELDSLNWEQRQLAVCQGLMAGNVFDWGAQAVVSLMEAPNNGFSFQKAMGKVQSNGYFLALT